MSEPVVLIIRDGWGINPGGKETAVRDGNATLLARTPFHDFMAENYPMCRLSASGLDVGLPEGQMGNSEVGHLNLGAGRIVYQDLTRIHKAIADGELGKNEVLQKAFVQAKRTRLHVIGLVSDGGVHSHQDHLISLVKLAKEAGVGDVMTHAITDGRDCSPTGGAVSLAYVETELGKLGVPITTVVGRYYAMDRDKRWERTKLAWDAIVEGVGEVKTCLASEAIAEQYGRGKTDEFLTPMIFSHAQETRVRVGDVVLVYNFRADRVRQISDAFLKEDFCGFEREHAPMVHYYTMTEYDETYDCEVVFPSDTLKNTLGEVVSRAGLRQLRIAETEKYPHVTYFFNGGVELVNEGEIRTMAQSPRDVDTYDQKPEMSAAEVTEKVLAQLDTSDLVILNFANPDMVGHTGVVEAGIKAVETIDTCLQKVVEKTLALNGKLLITADHGNCEFMRNADGSPNTAHTTNLVQCWYVAKDAESFALRDGILADVAPTLLDMLGLEKPVEMTGITLRKSS